MEKYKAYDSTGISDVKYLIAVKKPCWKGGRTDQVPDNFITGSKTWTNNITTGLDTMTLEKNRHAVNFDISCFKEITKEEYFESDNAIEEEFVDMDRKERLVKLMAEAKRRGFVPGAVFLWACFTIPDTVKNVRDFSNSGYITLDGGYGVDFIYKEKTDTWATLKEPVVSDSDDDLDFLDDLDVADEDDIDEDEINDIKDSYKEAPLMPSECFTAPIKDISITKSSKKSKIMVENCDDIQI